MGQCLCTMYCHHDTSCRESSPGPSDECRPAPGGSDQTNRPVGCYMAYIHHRHLLLLDELMSDEPM